MHKQSLREALFVEQRFLCVYCEAQVQEAFPFPPVEHWNPLSVSPLEVFTWSNLYLSCRTVDACDDRKKDRPLEMPWPVDFAYEDVFGYASGGQMYVRRDVTLSAVLRRALEVALDDQPGTPTIRSTLNLNHPALRAAREAAIEAEEAIVFGPPPLSDTQRLERARSLLAEPRRDGFVSARLARLLKGLGDGR